MGGGKSCARSHAHAHRPAHIFLNFKFTFDTGMELQLRDQIETNSKLDYLALFNQNNSSILITVENVKNQTKLKVIKLC